SLLFFLPHKGNKLIKWYTICICIFELLLTTYAFCYHFRLDDPLIQLAEDYKWINFFDFYWRLGIDGLSIGPILLTGFITTLVTLAAWPVTRDSRLFHFLMLAMYSGGSIFLLIGVLGLGLYGSNEPTLNFETLANQSYPVALEIIFYIGFLIALAVKSPIIPLHTWLPDTHGEAHYSTCMLLAGILLKMGAYGLVRINMELLPHAHSIFSPWLIIVGIGSITDTGLNGAILQIISHGFIGAALFFLAGTSYDRMCLVYLDEMGGMAVSIPKIFTMFSILSMASLALPGMSGFVAELIVFFGIITSQKYFLMPKILITFVMEIGMILTPIYSLSMSLKCSMDTSYLMLQVLIFFYSGPRELFVSISIFLPYEDK
ncbi:hypothetical protein ES319_D03G086000v1, partial [Gossypium barbadense]